MCWGYIFTSQLHSRTGIYCLDKLFCHICLCHILLGIIFLNLAFTCPILTICTCCLSLYLPSPRLLCYVVFSLPLWYYSLLCISLANFSTLPFSGTFPYPSNHSIIQLMDTVFRIGVLVIMSHCTAVSCPDLNHFSILIFIFMFRYTVQYYCNPFQSLPIFSYIFLSLPFHLPSLSFPETDTGCTTS